MNKIPRELYDFIIKDFDIKDLKNLCFSNKNMLNYCKNDKKRIVKKYLNLDDLDSLLKDFLFLFKNKKELYEYIFNNYGNKLFEYLDEEYPVNQNTELLEKFGMYIALNWEKYITINPMITLLWYVHCLQKKPNKEDLKKLFKKIPKSIIEDILENDKDWFNTTNIYSDDVFNYLINN